MNPINVICIPEGLSIRRLYPHPDQIETVFGFTTPDNYDHLFTYPYIHINILDHNNWKTIVTKSYNENNIINIDKAFLFYSYNYQRSYCHFMHETAPKLADYLQNFPDYKLLIPGHLYNNLYKNIVKLCNISDDRIIALNAFTIYNIQDLKHGIRTKDAYDIQNQHYFIYKILRNAIPIKPAVSKSRLIYLKRDGVANSNFGNDETGKYRVMKNQDELCAELQKLNFEIITVGNKTIEEKYKSLKDAKLIITQLGANGVNLYFTNAPKKVLYLTNANCTINLHVYTSISSQLNNEHIPFDVFTFTGSNTEYDPLNGTNSSFTVNIAQVLNYVKDFLKNN